MTSVTPNVAKRLATNALELVERNRRILVGQFGGGGAGVPLLNSLKKIFPELTTAERRSIFDIAKQSRVAISELNATPFRRGNAGAAIPTIEDLSYNSRARGRIRYSLWVETKQRGSRDSSYIRLNVYSNTPLSSATLSARAAEILADKVSGSAALKAMGLRKSARVVNIDIVGLLQKG